MAKITGVGGVFFKSKGDGKALASWYQKHLGMTPEAWGGVILKWPDDKAEDGGLTVWHVAGSLPMPRRDRGWRIDLRYSASPAIRARREQLMGEQANPEQTAPDALKQWRTAERTVAVARRGRLAAQAAAAAAQEAADAAIATAESSKAALAAATLAETSAARTATAAKLVVESTLADVADSETETAFAEVDEAEAKGRYHDAAARAAKKKGGVEAN